MSIRFVVFALAIAAPSTTSAQRATHARTGLARHASLELPASSPGSGWLEQQQPARRRSEGGRIALQFLAASAGAAGGGLGTYLLFRDVGETRVVGDAGYTRAGNVAYLVGSMSGATLGAHLVGRSMGGRSPLWATTLGAVVGTAPLLALGIDEPYMPLFGIALGWIPQAALATGGFNMAESRRK